MPDSRFQAKKPFANVFRWMSTVGSIAAFADVSKKYAATATSSGAGSGGGAKSVGSFFKLKGAVEGKVVCRFPPEASGFLHIGHAKAALTNQHLARQYKGKLILRFDDTNPAKEDHEFEKAILEDLKLLGFKHDEFTRTSDHFEWLLSVVDQLIKVPLRATFSVLFG